MFGCTKLIIHSSGSCFWSNFFHLLKKIISSREANFLTQNFALQTQQPGYRFSRIIFIFSLCGGKLCLGKINNPAGARVVNGPGKFQNKSSPNSNSRRPRRILRCAIHTERCRSAALRPGDNGFSPGRSAAKERRKQTGEELREQKRAPQGKGSMKRTLSHVELDLTRRPSGCC